MLYMVNYGNIDPINIPPMNVSIYTSTMDPSWDMEFHIKYIRSIYSSI